MIRVVFQVRLVTDQGGLITVGLTSVVFDLGGHQGGFASGLPHQGGLSPEWSHQGGLSPERSLIRVVFHQGGLASG